MSDSLMRNGCAISIRLRNMKNSGRDCVVSFEEAFEIVMISARRLWTERVSIIENGALNRVLREDVASDIDIPPFDESVMDGFACRRADLGNELTVIETVAAGCMPKRAIGRNQCARIMTGAVVPDGAGCVVSGGG